MSPPARSARQRVDDSKLAAWHGKVAVADSGRRGPARHVYQQLVDACTGRSDQDALHFYSELTLLLINQVGSPEVIAAAISLAQRSATPQPVR